MVDNHAFAFTPFGLMKRAKHHFTVNDVVIKACIFGRRVITRHALFDQNIFKPFGMFAFQGWCQNENVMGLVGLHFGQQQSAMTYMTWVAPDVTHWRAILDRLYPVVIQDVAI